MKNIEFNQKKSQGMFTTFKKYNPPPKKKKNIANISIPSFILNNAYIIKPGNSN